MVVILNFYCFWLRLFSYIFDAGDCEAAVCGGVNCIVDPWKFASLSKAKTLSPDGISKPFSGYGIGEGCGVFLLKPLIKVGCLVGAPHLPK